MQVSRSPKLLASDAVGGLGQALVELKVAQHDHTPKAASDPARSTNRVASLA